MHLKIMTHDLVYIVHTAYYMDIQVYWAVLAGRLITL